MALDLSNTEIAFEELLKHLGHKVVVVCYGADLHRAPENVAIECETCGCVLIDFNHPDHDPYGEA